MPSPRFARADPAVRERVLEAVQTAAEREGLERVSLHQVIADAALSRSAGYTYFDGRDELVDWAIDETVRRAGEAVGEWMPAADAAALWTAIADASRRVREHVRARPARALLLAAALTPRRDGAPRPLPTAWMSAAYRNAERLGLVAPGIPSALLERATIAAVVSLDEAELAVPGSVRDGDVGAVLARLWGSAGPTA